MKRLAVVSTGGTIAMSSHGGAPAQLLASAAATTRSAFVSSIAEVDRFEVLNSSSASLTRADIAAIIDTIGRLDADGVVITHGTDTLEETAFALQLAGLDGPPVVLTGSMRRGDQPGADGDANFEAAALVALSPQSRGKGVLVVMDDEIHWAPLVRKTHAFRTHAFSSAPFGPVGWVSERTVRFALAPALRYPVIRIGPRDVVVPIIEAGQGFEPVIVERLASVADAMVLSLPGGGHVSAHAVGALEKAASAMPVVFTSRTGAGRTLASSYGYAGSETELLARGLIGGGALDARKARVLLAALLSTDTPRDQIAATFAALP
jgi:L-asparaginase